ncbi:MAG: type II secretion system GspH family protein [Campylobacteraceae bacterium]|jgi:general secretion pathway protein G|nr:type II secretion system GspH family protein [Campylobacteraceae bacterium]
MKRSAFTMVELVFVIVILGILASIAVPRLAASRDDAMIAKGKADTSAIRSSIITIRSQTLLAGNASFPDNLTTPGGAGLFNAVLDYPVRAAAAGESGWSQNEDNSYTFRTENTDIKFQYNSTTGVFTCIGFNDGADTPKGQLCTKLAQ